MISDKRRYLKEFMGVLSGKRLEKTILEMRRIRNEAHKKRMKKIIEALKE
ncbi:MAG: hypothetical protein Q8O84_02060 [Nanoarchaeota archaeon]|nr:hypothetical protein [Nanoarchaeota archaeon]